MRPQDEFPHPTLRRLKRQITFHQQEIDSLQSQYDFLTPLCRHPLAAPDPHNPRQIICPDCDYHGPKPRQ